jgi:WD40 repeat protein
VVRLALSPDGGRLASTGEDRVVKVWDVKTGHEALLLDIHSRRINGLAFSPDGHRLASGSADGTVKVSDGTPWVNSENGAAITWTAHQHKVIEVAFSPDSQLLVSASWDKTVKIWDLNSGEREMSPPRLTQSVPGFTAVLTGVAFCRDGRHFAAASMDGTVKVCDAHTGQEICTLDGKAGPVHGVAFSPIANSVASAHDDGTVKIWDIERGGSECLSFQAHSDSVLGVAYSPDCRLLASAGGTGQDAIALWEVATRKAIHKLNPSRGIKWSVAFSPDGRCLACVTGSGCPLLDVATGREIHPIQSVDNAYRAAFSSDGRWLATACEGQTVRLWDVATGQELTSLRVSGGELWGVAFSPDGRYLASCSGYKGNGTIQIWDRTLWDKRAGQ